jgi:hypothetical protein
MTLDLGETGWGSMEWIQLAKDRGLRWSVVNAVINRVLAQRSSSSGSTLYLVPVTTPRSFSVLRCKLQSGHTVMCP